MKNRTLHFLLAFFAVFGAVGMNAQSDVTSTYLTNASFDTDANYLFDATASSLATASDGSTVLAVTGWTQVQTGGYNAAASFEYGYAGDINGATIPTTGPNGESGTGEGCIGFSQSWGGKTEYYQTATLPAGSYTLTYTYYNMNTATLGSSLAGWVPDAGDATLSSVTSFVSGEWTTDQVDFLVTAESTGKIQIGVQSPGSGSGSNAKVFFDDVALEYTAPALSLDATLSNLTASTGTLSPAFASDVYEYSLQLDEGTTEVVLTATENDASASASGDGTIAFTDDQIVNILVTAEAGNTQTYQVKIKDDILFNESFDIDPNYLVASSDNLGPANNGSANLSVTGWDLDVNEYSTSATFEYGTSATMNGKAVPAVDADGGSTGAALGIMASWSAYIKYSQEVTLSAGTYTLSYKVYNANTAGSVGKSLAGWIPDAGTASMSALDGSFTAETWISDEVVFVLDAETSGIIQIGMEATAHNGPDDKAHVFFDHIQLTKLDESAIATLSDITISDGALIPVFEANTTSYVASVASGATSVNINATRSASVASFTINGTEGTDGVDVEVPITDGLGTATIVVTSQDDSNEKTYTIAFKEECFSPLYPEKTNLITDPEMTDISNFGGWGTKSINTDFDYTYCGATSGLIGAGSIDAAVGLLQSNTTYKVKAMVYAATTDARIGVYAYGDGNPGDINTYATVAGEWAPIEFVFTTLENPTGGLFFNNSAGSYIDNWELYEVDNDMTLSSLTVSTGTLSEDFDPAVTTYDLVVAQGTDEVTFTGVANSATSSVTGDGVITLTDGSGTAEVVVTAESGNSQTYTINIVSNSTAIVDAESAIAKVYPTVSTGDVTVEFADAPKAITVYSLTGSVVKQIPNPSVKEVVSIQGSGIYLIKVESETNTELVKVVIGK